MVREGEGVWFSRGVSLVSGWVGGRAGFGFSFFRDGLVGFVGYLCVL